MNKDSKQIKILVADDEDMILDLFKDVLCTVKKDSKISSEIKQLEAELFRETSSDSSALFFDVETYQQGDKAIEAVKKSIAENKPFSVAFLDVRMPPGLDGVRVAEKIRALDSHIEIVIVTGYSDINPREIARRIPPAHKLLYIQKPFHPQEIYQFAFTLGSNWLMERKLNRLHEKMERKILERTHELKVANEKLRNDIVKRKKIEAALYQSENKYRNIVEQISDHICIHDLDGKIIETNANLKENLGYSYDELVNMNIRKLLPERHKSRFDAYLKRIKANRKDEGIIIFTAKDGRELVLEYRNILVHDSENRFEVHGTARDITDRMLAEEALRESEEKYRTILDSLVDGYFEVDLAGNFVFFNQALCELHGYPAKELLGMNYKAYTDRETADRLFKIYNNVYATGKPGKVREYKIIKNDGTTRIVETPVSLIKDKDGEPIGFRGLARDVTDQRNLENQLHQAQKMEAVGTLAGGVAHDLNNILSGIVSLPELLLMDMTQESSLRKPLQMIKKSGEKASAIVQDMLTLARRSVAVKEVVNLNFIVPEYLKSPEFNQLQLFHQNVKFETDLNPGLLNISGSPVHLSKTVMNLISNASEAMPDGGLVTITTENEYIDRPVGNYETVKEGDYAVLKVQDNGIGISADDLGKIFEPFYTKKVMGRSGTGLGMAVVWGTVKDHNGYIDVQSTEGKGTTFRLYFPVTRETSGKDKPTLSVEVYLGNGEKILIVDDVVEQREIAFSLLKRLAYSPVTVSSGEEAVAYLKNNSVDLLVLDMIMDPGMDGFETYKKILQINPRQKAIIASGFSETDRVKEVQYLGAGVYIKKPYTIEKLGVAIRNELKKANQSLGSTVKPKIQHRCL